MNRIHIRERLSPQKNSHVDNSYLLEQIMALEETIKQYKTLILEMKHRYLEMEQNLS